MCSSFLPETCQLHLLPKMQRRDPKSPPELAQPCLSGRDDTDQKNTRAHTHTYTGVTPDIFYFFLFGRGEGGSLRRQEGGGGQFFFLKIPGARGLLDGWGWGGGKGAARVFAGNWGGGLNFFFRAEIPAKFSSAARRYLHGFGSKVVMMDHSGKGGFWRVCPRSGFLYPCSVFRTLVPGSSCHRSFFVRSFRFWVSREHLAKPPFGNHALLRTPEKKGMILGGASSHKAFLLLSLITQDFMFGVAQTVFLVNRVFVPCRKGGVLTKNGENDETGLYPLKTRASLLRPRKQRK